jgi:hypothetical protein
MREDDVAFLESLALTDPMIQAIITARKRSDADTWIVTQSTPHFVFTALRRRGLVLGTYPKLLTDEGKRVHRFLLGRTGCTECGRLFTTHIPARPEGLCTVCCGYWDRHRYGRRTWRAEALAENVREMLAKGVTRENIELRTGLSWASICTSERRLNARKMELAKMSDLLLVRVRGELVNRGILLPEDIRIRRTHPSLYQQKIGAWVWTVETTDGLPLFVSGASVGSRARVRPLLAAKTWDVSADAFGDVSIDPVFHEETTEKVQG